MKKYLQFAFAAVFLISALSKWTCGTYAQEAEKPVAASADVEGDKAWKELEKAANTPPIPPVEWRDKQPTDEELQKFRTVQREMTVGIADKAKEFYTKFPKHPKAGEARTRERDFLKLTMQLGGTNQQARLESLEKEQLNDPNLGAEEKFQLRAQAVHRAAIAKKSEGQEAAIAEFYKGTGALLKEFPDNPEVYSMLWFVASNSKGEMMRAAAKDIIDGPAPEELKVMAKGLLKKLDAVGKPLALEFTAVDGRKVDVSKMKGKVVLIDFWATWCGPCIAALPELKAAYEKFHPKGLEVVGISFDEDKERLLSFVAEEKMTWPHYFDGLKWENKIGREFGINSIPAMWLVDKKGVLRDIDAYSDLEKKIEKLLAE